jgi:hypothetical protein
LKQSNFKGYWYIYIHSKLKERSINNELPICEVKSFLFEWRVPKNLRIVIIKELEQLGLIEIQNRNNVKFNNSNIDLDNLSNIFETVGILIE